VRCWRGGRTSLVAAVYDVAFDQYVQVMAMTQATYLELSNRLLGLRLRSRNLDDIGGVDVDKVGSVDRLSHEIVRPRPGELHLRPSARL
jgi:hypothetical protein